MGFKGARVINVTGEGWADRMGVIVGDEIVEIGGTGFSILTDEEKIDLFKQPRPFDIRFKRPARMSTCFLSSDIIHIFIRLMMFKG